MRERLGIALVVSGFATAVCSCDSQNIYIFITGLCILSVGAYVDMMPQKKETENEPELPG